MSEILILGGLGSWLLFVIAAGMVGAQKGQTFGGIMLGIFFGPLGLMLALLSTGDRLGCPMCMELFAPGARICPHCQTKFAKPTVPIIHPGSSDDA